MPIPLASFYFSGGEWSGSTLSVDTHVHTKGSLNLKVTDVPTQILHVEESHFFFLLGCVFVCSHIWHILLCIILWCNQQLEVMRVRRVIDRFFLNDKRGDRHKIPTAFFLTTSLFSFYQRRSAAETGPSVLDSGDTEEMDVQAVKGKSFISVDPLGQVDWSWAFWFGFDFAFFPPQIPHCSCNYCKQRRWWV